MRLFSCVYSSPSISFAWGKVEITTWTHKIDGLTQSDFAVSQNRSALQSLNPALCVSPVCGHAAPVASFLVQAHW
jgi:hypothetical protein